MSTFVQIKHFFLKLQSFYCPCLNGQPRNGCGLRVKMLMFLKTSKPLWQTKPIHTQGSCRALEFRVMFLVSSDVLSAYGGGMAKCLTGSIQVKMSVSVLWDPSVACAGLHLSVLCHPWIHQSAHHPFICVCPAELIYVLTVQPKDRAWVCFLSFVKYLFIILSLYTVLSAACSLQLLSHTLDLVFLSYAVEPLL